MAMLAKKYNFHLTYLGTGCIFKFDEDHPYGNEQSGFKESDLPNFYGSSYSTVKVGFAIHIPEIKYECTGVRRRTDAHAR